MILDEPSVTGTANIIMAAVMAKGCTVIYNAACEPYIQQLCKMLNRMGANIRGIGSNMIEIDGVEKLGGTTHRMLPPITSNTAPCFTSLFADTGFPFAVS